jgi:hypothetical protein
VEVSGGSNISDKEHMQLGIDTIPNRSLWLDLQLRPPIVRAALRGTRAC